MSEKLGGSLQLAVLAALCFDKKAGAAIATIVSPEHFDNVYQDFVGRVLRYRRSYKGAPPGKTQIKDLISRTQAGRSAESARQLRIRLLAEREGLNCDYVLGRVQDFVRSQTLKAAIISASERYNNEDDELVVDVEKLLYDALKFRSHTIDRGTWLADPSALGFLEQEDYVSLDIRELDRLQVGLVPKEVLLYIAPKGTGKSWFCIWAGRCALLQRQKVLHISLEMSEQRCIQRYYQTLFAVAKTFSTKRDDPDRIPRAVLKHNKRGKLIDFKIRTLHPRLDFGDPGIRKILRAKMDTFGKRYGSLIVKAFPTGNLTIPMLENYLDYLAEVENFTPHVLIVDYPDLCKVDARNYRIDLGKVFENLRGVCVARNMAGVFPTQGSRKTIGARYVGSKDAAEDIRKVNASDTVLTFSRTKAEAERGLGRLSVEHGRNTREGSMILLSQSYATGQYVRDSAVMQQKPYWDRLKKLTGGKEDDEEDDPQERD